MSIFLISTFRLPVWLLSASEVSLECERECFWSAATRWTDCWSTAIEIDLRACRTATAAASNVEDAPRANADMHVGICV